MSVDSGKLDLEAQPFSLRKCVESSVAHVRDDARRKGVKIAEVVHVRVPEGVRGDVERVRQVLLNLLSNAVKFTPSGGKIAVLVTARRAGDLHEIQFAVSDSGIGIAPEQQARLFQPFAHDDSRAGGTGVGLSACKQLVELMGGRLWLHSEPGHGSTFNFTIQVPAATLDAEAAAPGAGIPEPVSSIPHDLAEQHPLRILVAEDNLVNQMVVRLLLARLGYMPDFVGNGRDALAAVEKTTYDVVLMDLHMPLLDGLAAAREICARVPAARRPRIVGLTASAIADDRRNAAEAGMEDYVAKPITADAIVAVLRRCPRLEPAPSALRA